LFFLKISILDCSIGKIGIQGILLIWCLFWFRREKVEVGPVLAGKEAKSPENEAGLIQIELWLNQVVVGIVNLTTF
jgi:hypothetical protein